MNCKKLLLVISFLIVILSISAHEFWLEPEKFIYNRTETLNIRFLVGENFEGINWKGNNDRISSLRLYYGGVSDDLSDYISSAEGDSLAITMIDEGTCMIAFNSNNSFIELNAEKFNEYLKEDGLPDILEFRKNNNELDSTGYEYYQRCAKTLIQVGPVMDRTYSVSTQLPVDIIALSNPYNIKEPDSLTVRIYFQKKPFVNASVNIWHRVNGFTEKAEYISDEKGDITFAVFPNGKWMVSTVKMERLEDDPKANWQSFWGSLTWGYE